MNSESHRIANQIRQALTGDPWHGSPLRDLLEGVTAEQAFAWPVAAAHTIWELVLHLDAWVNAAFDAIAGVPMPKLVGTPGDWPVATDDSPEAWGAAVDRLFQNGERFAVGIEQLDDARLREIVPGRQYDFYHLGHGIVQHFAYHGGQIGLLRKALFADSTDIKD